MMILRPRPWCTVVYTTGFESRFVELVNEPIIYIRSQRPIIR
jgi:hypothetical protein